MQGCYIKAAERKRLVLVLMVYLASRIIVKINQAAKVVQSCLVKFHFSSTPAATNVNF